MEFDFQIGIILLNQEYLDDVVLKFWIVHQIANAALPTLLVWYGEQLKSGLDLVGWSEKTDEPSQ